MLRREKETEGREGGYSQTKALELERVEGAADVRSLRGVERTHLAGPERQQEGGQHTR